jgi:Escherichia/Staphylococcus phage prohead protease
VAVLSSTDREALPDSSFGYVEPGKAVDGKTPDKYRHFPIHDAAHVRNALARIAQGARFGDKAKAKVMAAAKKHGIDHDDSDGGRSYESLYPERRFIAYAPEIRSADGGPRHITGYAAVFNKLSRRLGGFVERVNPTAFEESRSQGYPGVVCRYNHKDDMVLGTTDAGTCVLDIDDTGLKYDVLPPQHRGDVLELVDRGDVRYSSFAFRVMPDEGAEEWGVSDFNFPMRTLHGVELVDVAPVLDPAYKDTSAAARSIEGAVYSLARYVEADVDEVRSYLQAGKAIKFFKRTDRASLPKLDTQSAADRGEARVLDDKATALRGWKYADGPTGPAFEETRDEISDEEVRAALKGQDQLCRKWTDGEPCVKGAGHDGDCTGPCWNRSQGLPCCKPMGHGDDHEPMSIRTRSNEEEGAETRDENAPAEERSEEPKTLSPVQAMAMLAEKRLNMTRLDDEEAA